MTLGEYLKNYRNRMGLSQRAFAMKCNVSHAYIGFLEKGINPSTGEPMKPSLLNLYKISNAMGIGLDELFASVDDMAITLDNGEEVSKGLITDVLAKRKEKPESPEQFLLRAYRSMDQDGQQRLIEQATMLYEKYKKE